MSRTVTQCDRLSLYGRYARARDGDMRKAVTGCHIADGEEGGASEQPERVAILSY